MSHHDSCPIDDEPLSDNDRAAIERAAAEPGIVVKLDQLEQLLAGGDNEVAALLAAGKLDEALLVARFNAFERANPFYQRDHVARIRGA